MNSAERADRFIVFEHDSYSYHCRLIHEGVRRFFMQAEREVSLLPLAATEVDLESPDARERYAVICWMRNQRDIDELTALGIPFLNLCEATTSSNVGLRVNFSGEGFHAKELLVDELGIEHLIFVGIQNSPTHQRRLEEFRKAASKSGIQVHERLFRPCMAHEGQSRVFVFDREALRERNRALASLMRTISKPAGFFCGDDRMALNLYYLARQEGIQAPEHISILGVGGVQRAEEGGVQAISVVQLDHIRQGYVAAELMENYLSGGSGPRQVTLSPDGIAHRGTTPRRAVKDPLVQRAFEIIDENRGVTVNELSRQLNVSRQTLTEHFLSATNMTAARAIDLERFRHAKQLLRSKSYNHEGVAIMAGYRNHKQMLRSFDRLVQMSPGQFCRLHLGKR